MPVGHCTGSVCGLRHLPFSKRVPRGQQLGNVPIMPVGHLTGSACGLRHLPFSKRMPRGQQLGNVPTGRSPVHSFGLSLAGSRQAPRSNFVPFGQQLGGVPTGRLRGHSVSSVPFDVLEPPVKRLQTPSSNRVSLGQQLGGVPTGRGGSQTRGGGGAVAGRRQTVPSKRVPCGQQLGGVPTGRLSGHTGFEADGLVPPLPVSQARPFQNFPAGQAHTPSASRIMPPVHSGGLGAVGGVATVTVAQDVDFAPSLRPPAALVGRARHDGAVGELLHAFWNANRHLERSPRRGWQSEVPRARAFERYLGRLRGARQRRRDRDDVHGRRAGDAVSEGYRRVVVAFPRIRQTDIESARRAWLAGSGPVLLIFKAKGGLAGVVLTVWQACCCPSPLGASPPVAVRAGPLSGAWPEPPGSAVEPTDAQFVNGAVPRSAGTFTVIVKSCGGPPSGRDMLPGEVQLNGILRRSGRAGERLGRVRGHDRDDLHWAGAGHLVGDGDGIVVINRPGIEQLDGELAVAACLAKLIAGLLHRHREGIERGGVAGCLVRRVRLNERGAILYLSAPLPSGARGDGNLEAFSIPGLGCAPFRL